VRKRGRLAGLAAALLAAWVSWAHLSGATLPGQAREPARRTPRANIVVSQDGSGDVRTIQAALDAIPRDNRANRIILVRNGTYREKLFITTSHVSIVGDDRVRTRVEFPELRRIWRESHPDDWGAAVVNIGDAVTDLVIANLTVHNTYGGLYGDHDHQFAIRSGGEATRIALLDANVVADGGDTLSLWNPVSGMYYHANCYFEGWVDYVCPRGWCYVTNSRFFGHDMTASIWHDGSRDRDAKLVIRRSHFDGVRDFPIGRNNRDGQFFLLDALFSRNMADRPIYPALGVDTYQWPGRYYYDNCSREGGDYRWFSDNLEQAEGRPRAVDITPAWTFGGRWDPENTLPAILPGAAVPQPEDHAREIDPARLVLRWIPGRNATAHRVYLGLADPLPVIGMPAAARIDAGRLEPGTTYRWRVDEVTADGVVEGPTWAFATRPLSPDPAATMRRQGPVRILLVGDSTVTDELGWAPGFKARLVSGVECANLARNGRSSRSYIGEGLWSAALEERADYVLIQFGHNDQPGKGPDRETDPATTYREFLSRYIDEARARRITPVIVTSLTRRRFGPDGRIASDLGPYAEAAREVGALKKAPVVDLHARSIEALNLIGPKAADRFNPVKEDGTPDRTHLTKQGAALVGDIVADELRRVLPALAPYITIGSWAEILDQPVPWYRGAEAVRIGSNVLLYQRNTGGWPKNIDMARVVSAQERAAIAAEKAGIDSTIDNGATTTQIRFLARVYAATRDEAMRAGVVKGLAYLLEAQYRNGGWPQFFPLRSDYSRYITFNDGVMVRTLQLMRDAGGGALVFSFIDEETRTRARRAYEAGLKLVLATQLRAGGVPTGWCAQYDARTLEPRGARSYEHTAIDSRETTDVTRLLMTIDKPSPAIVQAIEGAVSWLRAVAIKGWRVETPPEPAAPNGHDRVVVADPSAPPLWARFYQIGSNRPVYSGRDGVIKYSLAEIELERRSGYNWIDRFAATLLESDYPAWRKATRR
jgi:PelA/Pel-15E family pectate lyase